MSVCINIVVKPLPPKRSPVAGNREDPDKASSSLRTPPPPSTPPFPLGGGGFADSQGVW